MTVSDAMRDWVEQARAVPIEQEALRHGLAWKSRGYEMSWPCPACGGHDRFSINRRKQVFHCRHSGAGGDVIAMVQYLAPCDFLTACETLTGLPPPKGEGAGVDQAERMRREEDRARAAAQSEKVEHDYREAERARMWKLWRGSLAISAETPVGRYLDQRGLFVPDGAALRWHPDLAYFVQDGHRPREVHRGPAMVAAIVGHDGRFRGAHMTWVDPQTRGKATIIDPETGEVLASKKTRGSLGGNHIPLNRCVAPRRLVDGEGIETVLSVYRVQSELASAAWMAETVFWSTVSLGNLGGRAIETMAHPTERRVDKRGISRAVRVPGPLPDLDPKHPALMPPETVDEVINLGDGDSERFLTEMTHRRAAARWARPGRTIRVAWAPDGQDFNNVLTGAGSC